MKPKSDMVKVLESGKIVYKKEPVYEFLRPNTEHPITDKLFENALLEERKSALIMVNLSEKQITVLQQRINFWNQIRIENKKIAEQQS